MPYRVDIRNGGDAALDRLIELGALDIERLADGAIAALLPDGVPPETVAAVAEGLHVSVTPAMGRDADSVWVLNARPVRCGRIRIIPAHLDVEPGALRLIDSQAFGSGLHPTTALCLEALDALIEDAWPDAVLDVGTGSGILALSALMLGVPRAMAIDTDADAVRVASENARLNGLSDRVRLTHGDADSVAGAWPVVVANILAAPLIEIAPSLVRRIAHHGRLVLSGVPQSVEPDVAQAYCRLGMQRIDAKSRGGWVALVLQASW